MGCLGRSVVPNKPCRTTHTAFLPKTIGRLAIGSQCRLSVAKEAGSSHSPNQLSQGLTTACALQNARHDAYSDPKPPLHLPCNLLLGNHLNEGAAQN